MAHWLVPPVDPAFGIYGSITLIGGAGKDDRSGIRAGAQGIRYQMCIRDR